MFLIKQPNQQKLTSWVARSFSGHHTYERKETHLKSINTTVRTPVEQGDLDQEFGQTRMQMHNRITAKILGYIKPHRIDQLDNFFTDKYSAYFIIPRVPFLRNGVFLKIMASLFDRNRNKVQSVYDDPVQIHENSVFLYKSPNMPEWIGARAYDYFALGCLVYGSLFATMPLMWLPAVAYAVEIPKFYTYAKYRTYRADLLPHTEQVVFTKIGMFGKIKQSVVDISDISKISADSVKEHDLMFRRLDNDARFVWKDSETQEIFIFDSNGLWNEEGLNHPLLN